MKSDFLTNITPEQRLEMQEKARLSREKKKEAGKHLRQDFADESIFRENASKIGFRLASSYIAASEQKYLRRLLKHLDKDMGWWRECNGYKNVEQWCKDNPNMPAYYLQALSIEDYLEEGK